MIRLTKSFPRRWLTPLALLLTSILGSGAIQAAEPVRIAYVDWSSSVASANLICAVLRERLGQDCLLVETTAENMWRQVADGEADALLSAWLPDTHAEYMSRYGDELDDLGPNLEGTRTGLVVPDVNVGRQTGATGARTPRLMPAESIADLAAHRARLGGRIIGIDPEAGIMAATRRALESYGLTDFHLSSGSEQHMTQALSDAIARKGWIVVTGWQPHWMFGRWSLRFLDDPKGIYGGTGAIHTMARKGLKADNPEAHALLDNFHWTAEEMEQLLVWNTQGDQDPYLQAQRWLLNNPKQVGAWLPASTQASTQAQED
ncbi:Glycine betaine/carnitine transport binding protein GbuC precursor [Thiorhodovibrio winogradskyi]|uniref:Glycine betaine/carnitine transport binding protein GbuC n=1 Tax=Thiorhodovibrio winogradskyi TaxID=77007 RepID=A0ABZ0SCV1_9GAMM|nr:glycine betaine ABC transporter substrate-binding protein [Thiorhodovibrio winogradskyi]